MRTAAIERDLATNRRKQAEAQASAAAHHADAKASVDNPARFARASGRAANEERRLAIYREEEARHLEALPAAKRQDELELHERAVLAHDKATQALAQEWKREYMKHAVPIAELCKRLDENDRADKFYREEAKRLGAGASRPAALAETLARPSQKIVGHEMIGLRGNPEPGKPLTAADMERKVRTERYVHRGPIRGLINLPDFGDGKALWSGSAISIEQRR